MDLVKRETCLEYFRRRLSEGWKCISLEGHNAVLLSPYGIRRELDLRNDVETLRPNARGDECNIESEGGCSGCPDHYTCFVENGGIVYTGTDFWQRDLFNIDDPGVGVGIINHVTYYFRVMGRGYGAHVRGVIKSKGIIIQDASDRYPPDDFGDDTWGTYSTQWTTNPATGVAWTWDDIATTLQIGIMLENTSGWLTRCQQLYIEVDYTPIAATVVTVAANNIEEVTANPRGNVTDIGSANPTRYIDYDTDSGEPYANSKDCGVGGTGEYNSNLTGLSPGQKYYYRARVVNAGGTGTGSEMTFTTKPNPPTAMSATIVSSTEINVDWTKGTGAEKTMVRRKVGSYPTSVSDGEQAYFDTGNNFNDTGLIPKTHYYYRAWSHKTGAPNEGYSDEYAQANVITPFPTSQGLIII